MENSFQQFFQESLRDLYKQDDSIAQDFCLPLKKILLDIYSERSDLQLYYPINTREGRLGLLLWWLNHGQEEYPILAITQQERAIFLEKDNRVMQDAKQPIPKILADLYFSKQDLQENFDINSAPGKTNLLNWWEKNKNLLCPFLLLENEPTTLSKITNLPIPNGINIIGYPRGELGIGEDVRMAAKSLTSTNINFSVYDTPLSIPSRSTDNTLSSALSRNAVYHANLICMPGSETFRLATSSAKAVFRNRYNIAAWQWELPHWPKKWGFYLDIVDEIWAFSHFIETTFKEATQKPVIYMPMCVEYPPVTTIEKSQFNLPENKFLFLTMFDGNSTLTRKNLLATIHAFLKAFPKNNDVGLVIKAMNATQTDETWKNILEIAAKDTRIHILNMTFTRSEVMGLIQACDAFISLHRSEGFGRILAEALLLRKPVITTNFSGNTDFTTADTAFMVDGPLIALKPSEYPGWENQYWCDPDINIAAEKIITCYENQALREKLAANGQQLIRDNYSSEAVGKSYEKRLREIGII